MLIMSPLTEDVKERKHQGVLPTKSKIHFLQNLKQHLLRVKGILPTTVLLDTVACIIVVETHISGAYLMIVGPSGYPQIHGIFLHLLLFLIFLPHLCILLLLSLKAIFIFLFYFALKEELFIGSFYQLNGI